MKQRPKNIAASVRQRLLNRSRNEHQDFQRLLVRYAVERLLYRLSQSPLRDRFILKGAMLFATWSQQPFRSTGDLDLLGSGSPDIEQVRKSVAAICSQEVTDDGLAFDIESIRVEPAREEEEYQGARVRLDAKMGETVIPVQIDIGFGDSVYPAPKTVVFPVLLDEMPPAHVRAYPPETVIAEKFEAMVHYGDETSRLKDHYDLWALSRTFVFEKATLVTAIRKTFANRGVPLPVSLPSPLTAAFAARPDKLSQWEGFLRRTTPTQAPPPFGELLAELREFMEPVVAALESVENSVTSKWTPGEGWG
jgi:predicted nucleotidyltransferase component of viral defense system